MYRMQILGRNEAAMHWQRHKTGANHFEAWKKTGRKMPVSVSLGGDPVYTYAATAPLPENIDEYILAGFLRNKRVNLVKCITNDLYVPADADIILEGFVDPEENPVWEGPFGDHTGFYSLADWYPKFHITCITHRKNAVYPATIVGVPPQEDAFIARVTERIFLTPVKLAMLPEIIDFHMPDAGTAHNLVIVKIRKSYPGQGMKVLSSLFGAGQMMFSKYIVVISGDVDIRNYGKLATHVLQNLDPSSDILFSRGPLDVLDHAAEKFSFGGKAGIDATIKMTEELPENGTDTNEGSDLKLADFPGFNIHVINGFNEMPVILISYDPSRNQDIAPGIRNIVDRIDPGRRIRLVLAVNHHTDLSNYQDVAWQVLANSDPVRDHVFISPSCLFIDGTTKVFRKGGFPRKWPNVVCSDEETIKKVDSRWKEYGIQDRISSPSLRYRKMLWNGEDRII
jgi:4-hydroxy-3-polyprenylbenzoate decarboxylase